MINIWLDDLRPAPPGFIWIKTVEECKNIFSNKIGILSLDHDLGDEKTNTGYDFVKWLVEIGYDNPNIYPEEIYLHTDNVVGRQNMYQLLEHYKPNNVKLHRGPINY